MKRFVALGAGLLVLGLTVAACGGSDDDSGSGPVLGVVTVTATPTTSGTPTPSPAPTPTQTLAPTPTQATPTQGDSPPPSTSGADLTTPPHTYAEALAHIAAGHLSPGEIVRFATPSGNIYCALAVGEMPAACELSDGKIDDPNACPGAMTTRVGRIELQQGRAVPVCNTDTIRQPGAPVLDYGQVAMTRDTECVSEEIGVTCVSRSGQYGFFLHRGSYAVF